jgi:hypothetical protein
VKCSKCKAKTGVDKRTGMLNPHAKPGSREKCPNSGKKVKVPIRPPSEKLLQKWARQAQEVREPQAGKSVRTVSGGLPGLGGKR